MLSRALQRYGCTDVHTVVAGIAADAVPGLGQQAATVARVHGAGLTPGDVVTDVRPRTNQDRAERLLAVLVRDGDRCVWCGRAFGGLVQPTTDHLVPRVKGGPSWIENEVAACRRCNGRRGHQTPIDWLDECERRGWSPNPVALDGGDAGAGCGDRRAGRTAASRPVSWIRSGDGGTGADRIVIGQFSRSMAARSGEGWVSSDDASPRETGT